MIIYEKTCDTLKEEIEESDDQTQAEDTEMEEYHSDADIEQYEVESQQEKNNVYSPEIEYLQTYVFSSQSKLTIENKLRATRELRKGFIEDGATDLLFNLFKTNSEYLLFDFTLSWPTKVKKLVTEKYKLIRFLSDTERESGPWTPLVLLLVARMTRRLRSKHKIQIN